MNMNASFLGITLSFRFKPARLRLLRGVFTNFFKFKNRKYFSNESTNGFRGGRSMMAGDEHFLCFLGAVTTRRGSASAFVKCGGHALPFVQKGPTGSNKLLQKYDCSSICFCQPFSVFKREFQDFQ
jgi:hypothetical protein